MCKRPLLLYIYSTAISACNRVPSGRCSAMEALLSELQDEQTQFLKMIAQQQLAMQRMQDACVKLKEMNAPVLAEGSVSSGPHDHHRGSTDQPSLDEDLDPLPPRISVAGNLVELKHNKHAYNSSECSSPGSGAECSEGSVVSGASRFARSSPSMPKRLLTVEALLSDDKQKSDRVKDIKGVLDYVAGGLVLLNSLVMLAQFEVEGGKWMTFMNEYDAVVVSLAAVQRCSCMKDGAPWPELSIVFMALDIIFVVIFFLEWCVRVALDRWKFLHDLANVLDTFLVFAGIVDVTIGLVLVDGPTASRNLMLLRLMRAMKSLRAIRMVRSLRFFRGLRVLVKACQCFLPSLCWSMVLLGIFMSMGALVLGFSAKGLAPWEQKFRPVVTYTLPIAISEQQVVYN
eukprot:s1011_g6.t2